MAEVDVAKLRERFIHYMTTDQTTVNGKRAGKNDWNQAIFLPTDDGRGAAVWSSTDMSMVLDKFDHAVRDLAT